MIGTRKWKEAQKKKVIGMLKALIKKIENGEFVVTSFGWWPTNVSGKVIFRVDVLTHDFEQDPAEFHKF